MKTHGAVLRGPGDWEVVELDVLDPGPGQVLVEMAYAGLCHSDEHLRLRASAIRSSAATRAPARSSR
jgi:Zn-dependent alcohol dehydrogenase